MRLHHKTREIIQKIAIGAVTGVVVLGAVLLVLTLTSKVGLT